MTIYSDNAALAATTDRAATADAILNATCREVIAAYRCAIAFDRTIGHPPMLPVTEAATMLKRAQDSAARILGAA